MASIRPRLGNIVIAESVSMKNHSSFYTGGNAEYYAEPRSIEECLNVLEIAYKKNLNVTVIGSGTHILVSEKGIPGLVICTSSIKGITIKGNLVEAAPGEPLDNIINQANIIVESAKCDFSMLSSSAEERVVFSDKTSVKEALTRAITAESSEHVLKTDLQGLNMMLGHRGGFVRGEFAVIYGLSHHFKTGLLLTIARGIASQNKAASVAKPGKKPMILFITLENFANRNAYWFYKAAYACIFNQAPPKDMNIDEMVKIINDFYTRNGWEFILEKYKGINFGYDEYVKTIEKYEALGYDVVVSLVDYMEKMKKKSSIYDNNSDSHEALAALAQGLFDYNKSKEITFITPHQFNRQMQKVADQVKVNVIKHFSTDGVSGSIAINQIVDLELYVYIETDLDKQAWLTVMRGKHRYVDDTPIAHRYFAYPFVDKIGIVEDVSAGKKKMFVRDIYSNMSSSDDKKKKDNDVAMDLDTF